MGANLRTRGEGRGAKGRGVRGEGRRAKGEACHTCPAPLSCGEGLGVRPCPHAKELEPLGYARGPARLRRIMASASQGTILFNRKDAE